MRLVISGFVAVAVLAVATTMLWSHSSANHSVAVEKTLSQAAASASKLPVEEFEDMSMVFSTAPKR